MLSHFQAAALLEGRRRGETHALVSLDLGLTSSEVSLRADGVRLSDDERLNWYIMQQKGVPDAG